VVRDVRLRGPRDPIRLRFYIPFAQASETDLSSVRFLVRTTASADAILIGLREAVRAEDRTLPIVSLETGSILVERALVQERMIATLAAAFGALALGLACVGLYGLMAYRVVQRTSELGIRMALGARRSQLFRLVISDAVRMIVTGAAIGLPIALATSRFVSSMLFGLTPTDLLTTAGALTVLTMTGLLAAFVPASRATKVNPLTALRSE
jgi:predicted lysophospholipase L1 biosynthesis ABC-type transport system permease subunit